MPTEFLTLVLDTSQPDFVYFHAAFHVEHNVQKSCALLDLFWNSEKGSATMKDWMWPHATDLVCDTIHLEMESAKPHLCMSSKEVTPDFITSISLFEILSNLGFSANK